MDRFEIEERAGGGGMGQVYRARDLARGVPVAVKVLGAWADQEGARFLREAEILAGLRHPAVVGYVAHGLIEGENTPFLVMEWLEGETLAQRIARGVLAPSDAVAATIRAAEAVAAVHALGIIHRDIKPSNLFLTGGKIDDLRLIDFGIARLHGGGSELTMTGATLGTVGYMAPEQVRGARDIDARADVYSLGCVLFKCLTGRTPFTGADMVSAAMKVMLEEAPRIRAVAPEIPAPIDDLLARVIAKEPSERPKTALALADALRALGPFEGAPPSRSNAYVGLGDMEQRLVSVLAIGGEEVAAVRVLGAERGALFCDHADARSLTFVDMGGATDQAAQAARCALAARALVPVAPMAVATGRGTLRGRSLEGDVVDRAIALMRASAAPAITLDELTFGLLDARFDVTRQGAGAHLHGEIEEGSAARGILGSPAPFVGRDRELRALVDLFEECASEPIARAAVIVGEAGSGKSRLRAELLAKVGARATTWIARGDPISAGAPFRMLGQWIRKAARIPAGAPPSSRRVRIAALADATLPPSSRRRVALFVSELAGAPFPEGEGVELAAARAEARLMSDQTRRAFIELVDACSARGPLILVLEDLHWGDAPSVEHVAAALRALHDRPIFVLAIGRPDLRATFPDLLRDRGATEIALSELPRRASERLVREMLGEGTGSEAVAGIVERAGGNPFLLEELIRARRAGHDASGAMDGAPETVLAVIQTRLEALDGEDRRALRAASIFGSVFRASAVASLLGEGTASARAPQRLAALERTEWLVRRGDPFGGDQEYAFRHAIVRDAAYRMLTAHDLAVGHGLAADYLERAGESDAAVLAEHLMRSQKPARAAPWLVRAAEQALEGTDHAAVLAFADRAEALGKPASDLALLRATAHHLRGELDATARFASSAIDATEPGSDRWCDAAHEFVWVALRVGQRERLVAIADTLIASFSSDHVTARRVAAMVRTTAQLLGAGFYDRAEELSTLVESVADRFLDDPPAAATILQLRAARALFSGDAGGYLTITRRTADMFEAAGDLRAAAAQRGNAGYACIKLGAYDEAARLLRAALETAEQNGYSTVITGALVNLGFALGRTGAFDEAHAALRVALSRATAQGDRRMAGGANLYMGRVLTMAGRLDEAEVAARAAVEGLAQVPPFEPYALASLAAILRARGDNERALELARRAYELLRVLGSVEEGEAFVRVVLAECETAAGDPEAARAILAKAREKLVASASKIEDPALQKSFLENVPEHAQVMSLAGMVLEQSPPRKWQGH